MKHTNFIDGDRVYAYMSAKSEVFGPNTEDLIEKGQIVLNEKILYVRHNMNAAANIVKLIEVSDNLVVGETNIQNGKLPENNFFFIEAMRVAMSDTSTNDPKTSSAYTVVGTTWDPAIRNGEIRVIQADRTIIDFPLSVFTSTVTSGNQKEEAYQLAEVRHFLPQVPIRLEIECAQGDAAVEQEIHVEVQWFGRQYERQY